MLSAPKTVYIKRAERARKALEWHNIPTYFADTKEEARNIIRSLLTPGMKLASGGSQTLVECGIMDLVRDPIYEYADQSRFGEDLKPYYAACFGADVYFASANAITEDGFIYNVDGNSNRVAALAFGPEKVILVAGINKLVKNLAEADARVKAIAGPANAMRLNKKTPCVQTGYCMDCASPERICCNTLIMGPQRTPRITVILVSEVLGF